MLLQSLYFSRFLPNRPRPLGSFDTHARWVARNANLSISMILRENRGLWTVYQLKKHICMHVFMYVLFVKNEGEGEGGRGLFEIIEDLRYFFFRFMFTSSLPFITHFLYVQGYALIRKFSWILWFIIFFLTEVCLEVRRYKRPLFLNKWPAPFHTCPQVSQTRQKSGLRQDPIRKILARIYNIFKVTQTRQQKHTALKMITFAF